MRGDSELFEQQTQSLIQAGRNDERKRIIASLRKWATDYDSSAEGAGTPDFEVALGQGNAFREFAKALEAEDG